MTIETSTSNVNILQSNSAVRVLDIGSGVGSVAATVFAHIPNLAVTRMDVDPGIHPDIVHDITEPMPEELRSKFDIVYASHVLEHIDRRKVVQTFRYMISAVRNLGEVWIVVPSIEWAANEIINRREGMHVQGAIWGAQDTPWDYHRCGFTVAALRQMAELCGLVPRKAYQSPFIISFEGHDFYALQNVLVAVRVDQINDPAEALRVD